jgi:seryl-tRNA synthetase
MLDIRFIREETDRVKEGLRRKNTEVDLDALLKMDETKRARLREAENFRAVLNRVNKEIGALKREGKPATEKIDEMREVSRRIKERESEVQALDEEMENLLRSIPNLPHDSVPVGGESENREIRRWGDEPAFDFTPRPHWELAERNDLVDFKRGAKITGSGFLLFKNGGARLERALIRFFIDFHVRQNGFEEVSPPFLVNRAAMTGTGQLPKMEADMYRIGEDDLFLIPTAEVPVTNIFAGEILEGDALPIRYVAYSPCFRREAGSYGKDTRGMVRVHQFNKVEMVAWVRPEESYGYLETLTGYAEGLVRALKLPYRVLTLASGDLSFASSKSYDIEVWAPGTGRYLEVSSISNFEDFQARRMRTRYRPQKGAKAEYLHTLNGSGLALPRIFIAVLENYQNADGTVRVPDVLIPYMDGKNSLGASS